LGLPPEEWLAGGGTMRGGRDRGRGTVAAPFAPTLRALRVEPKPEPVAELSRRDEELFRSHCRVWDDTVPFLTWLRSRGTLTALVSNCADTTRAHLDRLGISPLVDA